MYWFYICEGNDYISLILNNFSVFYYLIVTLFRESNRLFLSTNIEFIKYAVVLTTFTDRYALVTILSCPSWLTLTFIRNITMPVCSITSNSTHSCNMAYIVWEERVWGGGCNNDLMVGGDKQKEMCAKLPLTVHESMS